MALAIRLQGTLSTIRRPGRGPVPDTRPRLIIVFNTQRNAANLMGKHGKTTIFVWFHTKQQCPFAKNRGAGLVYHLSSFTCCYRGKLTSLLINQPMGKGHLSTDLFGSMMPTPDRRKPWLKGFEWWRWYLPLPFNRLPIFIYAGLTSLVIVGRLSHQIL